jgi:hypothetical protein
LSPCLSSSISWFPYSFFLSSSFLFIAELRSLKRFRDHRPLYNTKSKFSPWKMWPHLKTIHSLFLNEEG